MDEKNVQTNNIRHKKNGGITLIALVITIIVMLILVAVTVSVAVNGGLFNYAKESSSDYDIARIQEELQAGIYGVQAEYYKNREKGSLRDYIFNEGEGKGQTLLSEELGATNLEFDEENNQITYKGVVFDVSEKGGVTAVGGTAIPENNNSGNSNQGNNNQENSENNNDQNGSNNSQENTEQVGLSNTALSVGDEVYITGVPSEKFYVIEASDSNASSVKLLAKYNVKTNATPYAQNSSANTVRFDDDSKYYSGSEIEALVKDYVSGNGTTGGSSNCKLNLTLGTGEEARLLLKSEIDALAGGGDTSLSENYLNLPSWTKDRNYWLGSNYYGDRVWRVMISVTRLNSTSYSYVRSFGVRPVLIVSKSRLSLSE